MSSLRQVHMLPETGPCTYRHLIQPYATQVFYRKTKQVTMTGLKLCLVLLWQLHCFHTTFKTKHKDSLSISHNKALRAASKPD